MNKKSIRKRIWEILEKGNPNDKVSFYSDIFLITLIIFNIIAVLLETVDSIYSKYSLEFLFFERFSTIIFLIEYILRIWVCVEDKIKKNNLITRLKYASTWPAIIDLLAVLSGLLPMIFEVDLRVLRALRMLRLLKFTRYFKAMSTLLTVLKEEKQSFLASLFLLAIALLIASTGIYIFEKDIQPEVFGSIPKSMWWAIATLTTVGYGDVAPVSDIGRFFGGICAIISIATVALPSGILASAFTDQLKRRQTTYESEVTRALLDGKITKSEQKKLSHLAKEMNLSSDQIKTIYESELSKTLIDVEHSRKDNTKLSDLTKDMDLTKNQIKELEKRLKQNNVIPK